MGIKNKSEKMCQLFLLANKCRALVIYVDYKFSATTYDSCAWQVTAFGEQFVHILYQCYEICKADGLSLLLQFQHPCGPYLSKTRIAQTS